MSGTKHIKATVVTIPTGQIRDWGTFHSVFQTALGFPEFYGRSMNAWIDCLTHFDDGDDQFHSGRGRRLLAAYR